MPDMIGLSADVGSRMLEVGPLTARSVALSTLLGYHPPALPISALIRVGRLFDIADQAMRTALSRMVAAGDVTATDGIYELNQRLVRRQARQEAARSPAVKPWDGGWAMAVVTAPTRPLSERIALRTAMAQLRFAELREGVWMRPDNLVQDRPHIIDAQCTVFHGRTDEDDVAGRLWDLPEWARRARELLSLLDSVKDLKAGFLASILVIRHLLGDPCLPDELQPAHWPAAELRERYGHFNTTFATRLQEYSQCAR